MKKLFSALFMFALVSAPAFGATLEDAKSAGLIGEKPDGYLGLVKADAPADVKALVEDTNSKRRAKYKEIAGNTKVDPSTVEKLAGEKAINLTPSGQFINVNGGWKKK